MATDLKSSFSLDGNLAWLAAWVTLAHVAKLLGCLPSLEANNSAIELIKVNNNKNENNAIKKAEYKHNDKVRRQFFVSCFGESLI